MVFPGSGPLGPMLLTGQEAETSDHWVNDVQMSGGLGNRSVRGVVAMEARLERV